MTGTSLEHLSESTRPEEDATEDARAAVRAMRAYAAQYRIDSSRIALSGDSAGAITSLWLGYRKGRAQQNGTSGNPGFSSDVRLVMPELPVRFAKSESQCTFESSASVSMFDWS